jgi:hypothetical protein
VERKGRSKRRRKRGLPGFRRKGSGFRNGKRQEAGSRKQELQGGRRQGSGFRNGNCLEAGSR